MNPIQQIIASARRRLLLQSLLDWAGRLVLAGCVAALGLLLAEHFLAVPMSWWLDAGLGLLIVLLVPILVLLGRPDDARVASLVDQRAQLKDRVASALYAQGLGNVPMAHQVVEDAARVAGQVHVPSTFRLRPGGSWLAIPPVILAGVLVFFFLPQDLLGLGRARRQAALEQQAQRQAEAAARDEVVRAVNVVRQIEPPREAGQPDSDLTKLNEQLADITRQDLSSPRMRQEAVDRLAQVSERLGQQADAKQKLVETMQAALSRLDTGQPGPADRFADALRRGDYPAAARELDRLAREVQNMSGPQKQQMMGQLQNLASQLAQMAQQQQAQAQQTQQQMQQSLQNAGLSGQAAQQVAQAAQKGASTQQLQQQLQQQGMSASQAQQMAQQLQQQNQQQQGRSRQGQSCNSMSQSLQQMAQGLKSGNGGQCSSAAGQGSQQLQQLAQMQQQLQQMRMAQQQAQQAAQRLSQGQFGGQGMGAGGPSGGQAGGQSGGGQMSFLHNFQPGQNQRMGGNGVGGGIGSEPGGNPIGAERRLRGVQSEAQGDIGQGEGRVIASWLGPGQAGRGDPKVNFNKAVTEARADAEKALTDDWVPRQYYQSIKNYFDQLPQSPDQVQKSAPSAPQP